MKNIKLFKQKGFTLTELMVGMAIGLIGTIIIFQVLRNSSSIVDNVSGGNDANQNGAIATYLIERDTRSAGFGLNQQDLMNCTVKGTRVLGGLAQALGTIKLNPVIIDQGASDAPDTLSISYAAEGSSFIAPTKLTEAYPGDATPLKVANRFGYQNGGMFLITDGATCTLGQVSALPSGGASDNLEHLQGTYLDQFGQSMPIQYNKLGGEGIIYPVNTRIYNIGNTPVYNIYSIVGGNLVLTNGLSGTQTTLITDVVDFQAMYGTNVAGTITWSTTQPASVNDFNNLAAIKFSVVARSNAKDVHKDAGGVCNTTTTAPSWSGGTFDLNANVGADWKCYRYKVFESTAYLKNMVWRPV